MTNKERHEINNQPKKIKANEAFYKLMVEKMGQEWADKHIFRICPVNYTKKI